MSPSDLSAEFANIKAYCRKEASKSFKHPLAPKPEAVSEQASAEDEAAEMSDAELDAMLSEG